MEATAERRRPGRPKGSTTDPQKKAAARARAAGPQPPSGGQPAEPPVTVAGDLRPDITAELAAAAVPPAKDSALGGGRPSRADSSRKTLAENLSTGYEAFGGMLTVAGFALAGVNPAAAARLRAVGAELTARADTCGLALARWADTSPRVKAWLANAATGSGLLLVIAAHAPIIAAAVGGSSAAGTADMFSGLFTPTDEPNAGADLASMFSALFTGADEPPKP